MKHLPDIYKTFSKAAFYPQLPPSSKQEFMEEGKTHRAADGEKVRSKSEVILISLLEKYHISYEYEPNVWIDGQLCRPDVKLSSPRDGREIYWEHFGRNDKQNYREKTAYKIALYAENGIVLWHNFIATFDDEEGGIDAEQMERVLITFVI